MKYSTPASIAALINAISRTSRLDHGWKDATTITAFLPLRAATSEAWEVKSTWVVRIDAGSAGGGERWRRVMLKAEVEARAVRRGRPVFPVCVVLLVSRLLKVGLLLGNLLLSRRCS